MCPRCCCWPEEYSSGSVRGSSSARGGGRTGESRRSRRAAQARYGSRSRGTSTATTRDQPTGRWSRPARAAHRSRRAGCPASRDGPACAQAPPGRGHHPAAGRRSSAHAAASSPCRHGRRGRDAAAAWRPDDAQRSGRGAGHHGTTRSRRPSCAGDGGATNTAHRPGTGVRASSRPAGRSSRGRPRGPGPETVRSRRTPRPSSSTAGTADTRPGPPHSDREPVRPAEPLDEPPDRPLGVLQPHTSGVPPSPRSIAATSESLC